MEPPFAGGDVIATTRTKRGKYLAVHIPIGGDDFQQDDLRTVLFLPFFEFSAGANCLAAARRLIAVAGAWRNFTVSSGTEYFDNGWRCYRVEGVE